jgi:uncharacterized protein YbjT (DUF2867 family)
MTAAGRTAVVLGGTGLVGGHLVDLLLDDPSYDRVVALGRRPVVREHARLEQRVDTATERHGDAFEAADVFCALGTTIRTAGSRAAFRAVDHDLVVRAAATAAAEGAGRFLLVSSGGASVRSPFFYSRVKA